MHVLTGVVHARSPLQCVLGYMKIDTAHIASCTCLGCPLHVSPPDPAIVCIHACNKLIRMHACLPSRLCQSGSQQPELYAWLRVSNVQPPEHGGLVAARLECSPGLAQLLEGREDLLAQVFSQALHVACAYNSMCAVSIKEYNRCWTAIFHIGRPR